MDGLTAQRQPTDVGQAFGAARRKTDAPGFARGLADVASAVLAGRDSPTESLRVITDAAVDLIPGVVDAAIVTPAEGGKMQAAAERGALPQLIIGLQNDILEGPCLDTLRQTEQIWASDIPHETRWPVFAVRAPEIGVRSMICTPLAAGTRVMGSLCLASPDVDGFDQESANLATVFATHAAIAMAAVADQRNLAVALSSRDIIGQAKGILMERHRLTADAAFQVLVRASQAGHVKLRDLCMDLCDTGVLPEMEKKTATMSESS